MCVWDGAVGGRVGVRKASEQIRECVSIFYKTSYVIFICV